MYSGCQQANQIFGIFFLSIIHQRLAAARSKKNHDLDYLSCTPTAASPLPDSTATIPTILYAAGLGLSRNFTTSITEPLYLRASRYNASASAIDLEIVPHRLLPDPAIHRRFQVP